MSDSLPPYGQWAARLLCPWNFPGKNTGVGCHFLLQRICLTQGSNLHLLRWQEDSLPLNHQENTQLSIAIPYYFGQTLMVAASGSKCPSKRNSKLVRSWSKGQRRWLQNLCPQCWCPCRREHHRESSWPLIISAMGLAASSQECQEMRASSVSSKRELWGKAEQHSLPQGFHLHWILALSTDSGPFRSVPYLMMPTHKTGRMSQT